MRNLRNKIIVFAVVAISSCNFQDPVNKSNLIGLYTASAQGFVDTLIIFENNTYFHVFHESPKQNHFSQVGKWSSTVNNNYELKGWRCDSTSISGADIFPAKNRFTGSVTFAYPLVTPEDIDYVKIQSLSK